MPGEPKLRPTYEPQAPKPLHSLDYIHRAEDNIVKRKTIKDPQLTNYFNQSILGDAIQAKIHAKDDQVKQSVLDTLSQLMIDETTEALYKDKSIDQVIDIGAKQIAGAIVKGATEEDIIEARAIAWHLRSRRPTGESLHALTTIEGMIKLAPTLKTPPGQSTAEITAIHTEDKAATKVGLEEARKDIYAEMDDKTLIAELHTKTHFPTTTTLGQDLGELTPEDIAEANRILRVINGRQLSESLREHIQYMIGSLEDKGIALENKRSLKTGKESTTEPKTSFPTKDELDSFEDPWDIDRKYGTDSVQYRVKRLEIKKKKKLTGYQHLLLEKHSLQTLDE